MGNVCHCQSLADTISQRAKHKKIGSTAPPHLMKRADFQIHYELKEGTLGKSCLVKHKLTNEEFAMKIICKKKLDSFGISIKRTRQIELSSPYIVQALGCFTTGAYFYIVSQYVYGTDLAEEIRQPIEENVVQRFSAQILLALQQFHKANIVYRNLTPSRILIDEEYRVKLLNFGIYDFILQPPGVKMATFSEDYFYKSPEQLRGQAVTFASDIWQLGVCIFEMLSGKRLFNKQDKRVYREEVLKKDLDLPQNISEPAARLLINMLCKDPSLRPGTGPAGMRELKSHQFFKEINWKQKERRMSVARRML